MRGGVKVGALVAVEAVPRIFERIRVDCGKLDLLAHDANESLQESALGGRERAL